MSLEEALDRSRINGYEEVHRWWEHFQVVPYVSDRPYAAKNSPWIERHGAVVVRIKPFGWRISMAIWYNRKTKELRASPPRQLVKGEWWDVIVQESHAQRDSFAKWVADVWTAAVEAAHAAGRTGQLPFVRTNSSTALFHDVRPDLALCPNRNGVLPWTIDRGSRREERRLEGQSGASHHRDGGEVPSGGGAAEPEDVGDPDSADAVSRFE